MRIYRGGKAWNISIGNRTYGARYLWTCVRAVWNDYRRGVFR